MRFITLIYKPVLLSIAMLTLFFRGFGQDEKDISCSKKEVNALCKDSTGIKPVSIMAGQLKQPAAIYYYSAHILPQNHYAACLGFFCKKELAVEKSTKIPLRFRLGSLSYCNQLEGKK